MRAEEYIELKEKYFSWLMETGQEEKAAEIQEKEGNFSKAIELYLLAGLPVRSA